MKEIQEVLDVFKTFFEALFYVTAIFGGGWAVWTFYQNQRLERSRWASALYNEFYETPDLKGIRKALDCTADSQEVVEVVTRERDEFTDYLNFFEHVAYLVDCRQILRADAEAYFNYYLSCLKRHPAVMRYINDPSKGYEMLARYLAP